jgi:hypothetical protein
MKHLLIGICAYVLILNFGIYSMDDQPLVDIATRRNSDPNCPLSPRHLAQLQNAHTEAGTHPSQLSPRRMRSRTSSALIQRAAQAAQKSQNEPAQ